MPARTMASIVTGCDGWRQLDDAVQGLDVQDRLGFAVAFSHDGRSWAAGVPQGRYSTFHRYYQYKDSNNAGGYTLVHNDE